MYRLDHPDVAAETNIASIIATTIFAMKHLYIVLVCAAKFSRVFSNPTHDNLKKDDPFYLLMSISRQCSASWIFQWHCTPYSLCVFVFDTLVVSIKVGLNTFRHLHNQNENIGKKLYCSSRLFSIESFTSLSTSNAIIHDRLLPSSVSVLACDLTRPNHYLNLFE